MRKSILKGNSVEEKLKHLDIVISRLVAKSNQPIVGLVSPYVISATVKVDGKQATLIDELIPFPATINEVTLHIPNVPRGGITVMVDLERVNDFPLTNSNHVTLPKITKPFLCEKVEEELSEARVIKVRIHSSEVMDTKVYIAFKVTPASTQAEVKRQVLDLYEEILND